MKILLCGWDGYIGYPLTQYLLHRGHDVFGIDNYVRRWNVAAVGSDSVTPIASPEDRIKALKRLGNFDCEKLDVANEFTRLKKVIDTVKPETIINLAQLPSAAFSMRNAYNANWNITDNVCGAMNLMFCMKESVPDAHMITLGTMGEYGTPNMPLPEGFFEIEWRKHKDVLPFPRQPGSIYHVTKVMTSDLAWFIARTWNLQITDIMQGIVFGVNAFESEDVYLTRFDIDECFGTMLNRAVACAIAEHPILVFGKGGQTRGYIHLRDSIRCITTLAEHPPTEKDSIKGYRVVNQLQECKSCNEVAELVAEVAEQFNLEPTIKHIQNPRVEAEEHYYEPIVVKLRQLGWKPHDTMENAVVEMFETLIPYKDRIKRILPAVIPVTTWR